MPDPQSEEQGPTAVAEAPEGRAKRYLVGMHTRIRLGADPDGKDVLVPVVIPNVLDLREQGIQVSYREEKGKPPIDVGTVDQFYANLREDFRDVVPLPDFSFSRDLPEPLQPIGGIRTTIHDLQLASGAFNEGETAFRVRVRFTPEEGKVHLPGLKQIYLRDCELMVQLGSFAGEPADAKWWERPEEEAEAALDEMDDADEVQALSGGERKALPATEEPPAAE